jgi:hypothetical protein
MHQVKPPAQTQSPSTDEQLYLEPRRKPRLRPVSVGWTHVHVAVASSAEQGLGKLVCRPPPAARHTSIHERGGMKRMDLRVPGLRANALIVLVVVHIAHSAMNLPNSTLDRVKSKVAKTPRNRVALESFTCIHIRVELTID